LADAEQQLESEEVDEEEANGDQEADYAAELNRERSDTEPQEPSANTQGLSFANPPTFKWGILLLLAIVNDGIDLLTLTGALETFVWLISMGLTSIILLTVWFTDGTLKQAQEYVSNANQSQQAQLASQAQQVVGEVRGFAEGISGKFKQGGVRKVAKKNPLARVALGSFFESIPFLGALNLITVWVFMGYLAEKHAYKSAQEAQEANN